LDPETHAHKITNVPVVYMALGLNDAGKSITQPLEGVGPESLYFQGPPPSDAPRNGHVSIKILTYCAV